MISVIITAWEEPEEIKECIRRFIIQKGDYEILITAPDEPTKKEVIKYQKKYPEKIKFYSQPRKKGKNEMLNYLIKKCKGDIIVFTDGDVFVNDIALEEISNIYKNNKKVGCVAGKILPQNSRRNLFGYWAHLLTYGSNYIRNEKSNKNQFMECSGYLYSIKKGILKNIPLDVAEDSIMPLLIWKKKYAIKYASKAIGYVRFPKKFKKWINQKKRCAKAHEKLGKYGGNNIRMKTFKNEILIGTLIALKHPKNIKEFLWMLLLFPTRFLIWILFFVDTKIKNQHYGDKWIKIHN